MPQQSFTENLQNFVLRKESVNAIFYSDGDPYSQNKFNNLLCKEFSNFFPGAFNVRKRNPPGKLTTTLYLYCFCSKPYRLSYPHVLIKKDEDLIMNVTSKPGECTCAASPKTRQVRGEARAMLQENMKILTNNQMRQTAVEKADIDKTVRGNFQDIKSRKVYSKIRAEMISKNDEHVDDLIDIHLKATKGKINNVLQLTTFPSVNIISSTNDQLKVLIDFLKKEPKVRLLFDATAKIIRKFQPESKDVQIHALIFPVPKKESNECYLLNIAELITNNHTGANLSNFFIVIRNRIKELSQLTRIADEIGSDFCFAALNAILSLSNVSMKEFLQKSFEVFETNDPTPIKDITLPVLCTSHLTKNIKRDINESFQEKCDQRFIAAIIGGIIEITGTETLKSYIEKTIIFLSSQFENKNFKYAKDWLRGHHGFGELSTKFSENQEDDNEVNSVQFHDYDTIYKDSRLVTKFSRYS